MRAIEVMYFYVLVLSLSIPIYAQSLPVDANTRLKYSFNSIENSVVLDQSGYGNHGIVCGDSWSSVGGIYDSAISLIAGVAYDSTDYIFTPFDSSQIIKGSFSLEVVFMPTGVGTQRPRIISNMATDQSSQGLTVTWDLLLLPPNNDSKKVAFHYRTGSDWESSTEDSVISQSLVSLGEWCSVLVSYDGAAVRLYMNGRLEREKPASGSLFSDTTLIGLTIGKIHRENDYNGLQDYYEGYVDEVRISDIARTPICGDANASGFVDIDDPVYLIRYIFTGGTPPLSISDVDCSGGIDIDDIVYLINYVFQGGPAPCEGCETGQLGKNVVGSAEIVINHDDGSQVISLGSEKSVKAVQLDFVVDGDFENIEVHSLVDGIDAFYGNVDGVFRVGLFDLYGRNMIDPICGDIVRITNADRRELRLVDAVIVAESGGHLQAKIEGNGSSEILPHDFALDQNYPNPFNPTTTISFSLPEAGNVKLDIYNIMGQTVATLVDEYRQAGTHEVIWNANGIASGVYFYRLTAGEFTDTKRMLLLK